MTKPQYLPKRYLSFVLALCLFSSVFSQNARKFFKAGQDFFQEGNYPEAIAQFTSTINLSPEYKEAYEFRGLSYQLLNEHQKAADDFTRAIVFDPENEILLTQLAKSYNELKKYPEALALLNKATSINRKFVPAYQEKIRSMLAMDKINDAIKISDSALSLQGSALNYYLQGIVTERLNSYQKAEWAYSKSIKEDKEFIDSYIALASLKINQEKPDEAVIYCNEALKIDPVSRTALLVRSRVFIKRLDFPNAINDISKNIANNPNDAEMLLTRGTYFQQYGQHQNAISDFNKVLSLDPTNFEAIYNRAKSFEEIQNFQAAIKDYEMLVTMPESEPKANMFLNLVRERLFELNRESDAPEITLLEPSGERNILEVPDNKSSLVLKGFITDKSVVKIIRINSREVKSEFLNNRNEFSADVPVSDSLCITATDVYNNLKQQTYFIKRTETNPPQVAVLAPFASETGEIFLESNDAELFLEGKISDENRIKSILIDGVTANYKIDELNPSFSATIDVNNKNTIMVEACDIYGNTTPVTFRLNRELTGRSGNNPMGKTWVVFVENSKYNTFASLEGPSRDVNLMKAALSRYQVNNIIHKKNMTKDQMEKFFSIELRDLVRSNHVNTLMIWYSGHGKCVSETGYWIPVDASRDDEFTFFNIQYLKAAMQSYASTVNHMLLISDACETGPAFYQAMRSGMRERNCNDWQASRMKSSQVFSSAGYELAVDNSQFTKTFASTLANNPSSCIPIESIASKVMNAVHNSNPGQKPQFGKISGLTDEDGTFFFMTKE